MTRFGDRNPQPTRASLYGRLEGARGMLKAAQDALTWNRHTTAAALIADALIVLAAANDELVLLSRARGSELPPGGEGGPESGS